MIENVLISSYHVKYFMYTSLSILPITPQGK